MSNTLKLLCLLLVGLAVSAPRTEAQVSFNPFVGYNLDAEALLVGVGGMFSLPLESLPVSLSLAPSVEYLFVDGDVTFLQIDVNAITNIGTTAKVSPFVGAGLALSYFSFDLPEGFDGDNSDTSLGLNLVGGASFPGVLSLGDPYVQARITLDDGTAISLIGGIRIGLGK